MNNKILTLGTLMGSMQSLDKLAASKLPINISFRISRLLKDIGPIIQEGFEKQEELVKQYKGKKAAADKKAFVEFRDELYAEEIDIALPSVTIKDLSSGMIEIDFAPNDLLTLEWLIKDDSE